MLSSRTCFNLLLTQARSALGLGCTSFTFPDLARLIHAKAKTPKQLADDKHKYTLPTEGTSPLIVKYPFPIEYYKDREAVVYDIRNKPATIASLPGSIFNVPVRVDILHRTVRWQTWRGRYNTHQPKTRNTIRGGGKKPWAQKKTGRARAGTRRSPIWVGGATVHGPVYRSLEHKLYLKIRKLSLKCALSAKYNEGRLLLIDTLKLPKESVLVRLSPARLARRIAGLVREFPRRSATLIVTQRQAEYLESIQSLKNWKDIQSMFDWLKVKILKDVDITREILSRDVLVLTTAAKDEIVSMLQAPSDRSFFDHKLLEERHDLTKDLAGRVYVLEEPPPHMYPGLEYGEEPPNPAARVELPARKPETKDAKKTSAKAAGKKDASLTKIRPNK